MFVVSGAAKLAARRAEMRLTPPQLFIGLARAGVVTADEAVAAACSGAIPAAIEAVIARLPDEAQVAARITWARMSVIERADPLVDLLAAAAGKSPAEIDAFFEASSQI
ncbi:hypothetical protein FJM51_20405 [Amaricoccus solimangrovi]|uniref:Uncharacterized protein n=2 Tax=Amaricoccus solimangrovi TaxID=2589815 RepID=A0A501WC89_9RHOB|nr:hypothetical protein FJM51_20405 [Amaricoccus solimangrovi]